MTVANQTRRIAAVGNAAIGQEVPFSFPYAATSDITVYSRVTTTGVETLLAETTNYTLTAASDTGGTLTTVTAVAATSEIHIIRDTPKTQSLDLEQGGSFSAENIEDALDKNTKLIIENKDSLDRALRAPATDAAALDLELPSSVDRASKNLGFDAGGNVTVTDSSGTFTTQTAVWDDYIAKYPIVDIRSRGAVGDDSTDDSAAIQAILNSLSSTGGKIIVPPLTFKIVTGLAVPVGVHIVIEGCGSNSLFHYTGTLNAITAAGDATDRGFGTYRDFKILGNANMDIGLSITYGTRRTSVENVQVETFNGSGIKVLDSWGLQLSHCSVKNGTGNGIYVTCTAGFGTTAVLDCNCENITGYGLLAEKTAVQVVGGIYETNTVNNIRLVYCRGCLISGIYIETLEATDDAHGIIATGTGANNSRGLSIIGCEIERGNVTTGTGYPIYLHNVEGVFIAGNHIYPHADAAGLTAIPHVQVEAACHNVQVGANDFRGISFTNVCKKVNVIDGATGIDILNNIVALADNATPSVSEGSFYTTGGTTTITDFDHGTTGQIITVLCKHSLTFDFTTAQDADHNLDGSSADITADTGDILKFLCEDGTTWNLISNLDASADNN